MPEFGLVSGDKITFKLGPGQIEWLNAMAAERATSVSDILRRLVDEARGAYLTPRKVRLKAPPQAIKAPDLIAS